MERIVAIAVLMAFVVNCSSPYVLPHYEYTTYGPEDIVTICEQVGEAIDAEEGQRFRLFTAIEGFKNARVYAVERGGYIIEIETSTERLVAVNGDSHMLVMLNEYIEDHDEISIDPAAFEFKWRILDYDTLGIPITETEVSTGVRQSHVYARKACATSCVTMGALTCVVAFGIMRSGASGSSDINAPLAAVAGLVVLGAGALIGTLAAGTVYYVTKKDAKAIINAIKQARKPRIIETYN